MKHILSSIITLAVLAFAAALVTPYTPNPNMAVLLGFALIRTVGIQFRLVQLKKKVELREASHARLVSRIDRMEWELIYGVFGRSR